MKICIKEQRFFNVRTVRGAFIGSKNFSFLHTRPTKDIHCCCSCYESQVCQFFPFKGSVVESIPAEWKGVPGTRPFNLSLWGM